MIKLHHPVPRPRLLAAAIAAILAQNVAAAPVSWVPDADGFWDVVTNWSSNPALPGVADDVTLDVGGATVRTITHRSGTNTINSLTSQESFSITNGTLNLSGASTVTGAFSMSNGTLGGAGQLTLSGGTSLSGGTMTGTGTTRLLGASTISNFNIDAGRILRNEGAATWTGNGIFEFNAASNTGAGRIDNAAGATFEATGNGTMRAINFVDVNLLPGFPAFNNAGTFRKLSGTGTTDIDIAFNNTGTVEVDTGTLELSGGGTHTGTFDFVGASLTMNGGVHTLQAGANLTGSNFTFGGGTVNLASTYTVSGTTTVSGGVINLAGATVNDLGTNLVVSGGSFDLSGATVSAISPNVTLSGGTLNLAASSSTINLNQTGGTLAGTGTITVNGPTTLSNGTMTGTGTTRLLGASTISNFSLDAGRILRNEGTAAWTGNGIFEFNAASNTGAGRIDNAAGATFEATGNGTMRAINFVDVNLLPGFPAFNNAGTFRKLTGTGTTTVEVTYNNTGTTDVTSGTLGFTGNVVQHAGSTLTGGTWRVSGNGILNLNEPGAANIVTNQGDVTLDGNAASFARINTLTNNQGALRLLNGRNFTAVGAFVNSGVLQLGGGIFGAPSLSNTASGEISGFGAVTPAILNSGVVRAAGGTLTLTGGIDGQSGTIQSDAGATLALGANSDADFLVNNGSLALGTANVTVAQDYTNANFGSGNAFNARANVSGTGQILASGNVAQTLTGDVGNGGGVTPSIVFGNVHVGDVVTKNYQIANSGTSGPQLRGAVQTTVNGGNLTDARLTGSGVTAGDFGPIATGANSGDRAVTFTAASAGALTNQSVAVVNNFDNVAEQVLSINGAAYRLAGPSAHTPEPIAFGNRRVGDVVSQALSITNNVPNDGFSEALDASLGATTGGVTATGSVSLLTAGATDSTNLVVGINTTTAGIKDGTAALNLASNGTGTSGLGVSALTAQTVNVSGTVFRLAAAGAHAPEPVVFANRHVGAGANQVLSLSNTAAADGFSERLNASIGGATAGITSNSGSFALLGAGETNNTSLSVGIDTSTAGAKSGTATITLASDGTGTSGFSALGIGTQTVNVSGNVYRLAEAGPITAVSFGNAHVGDVVSQALSLTNTAVADGFSEALNASFSGVSDARIQTAGSVSQLGAGATNNSNLVITLDTSTAGSLTGFATLALTSDGTGTSGLGTTSLGTRNVGVTTNIAVYRFADGAVENTEPVDLGAYRVGNVAANVGLGIRNTAVNDGFSESLNAGVGAVTTGFTASGAVNLLAAQGLNTGGIQVGVDTSLSGTLNGTVTVDFESDGAGTSELGQTARGNEQVALTARVYAEAVAEVQTPAINFGIVHVGDVVGARNVAVRNGATGDLTDSLLGSLATSATGFSAGGTLGPAGLAAGATNSTSLNVALDTSSAGVFSGNALANFATHNSELADGALDSQVVLLAAQVNNFANPVLAAGGGAGTLGGTGGNFTYDFGTLTQGTSAVFGTLNLTNLISGPADDLRGVFDLAAGPFALTGFDNFGGLAAGDSRTLAVQFDPLALGSYSQVVSIALFGTNASGFDGFIGDFNITLTANVNAVPLPAGVWMLGSALAGLIAVRRRRRA